MDTKPITAHVPTTLAKKVSDFAHRLERSKGWIVKQALTLWVAQEEERHRLTLEALADVDHDNLVDHEQVEAWAQSLDSDNPLQVPIK